MLPARGFAVRFVLLLSLLVAVPAFATSGQKLSDDQLVLKSQRIVEGRVTGLSSAWNAGHNQIWTTVTISVTSMIKGSANGGVVTVKLLGGQVGDIAADVPDQAHFELGENVIVFLRDVENAMFPTAGMSQGKLTLEPDPTTGETMVIERGVPRSTLVRDISKIVRESEGGR